MASPAPVPAPTPEPPKVTTKTMKVTTRPVKPENASETPEAPETVRWRAETTPITSTVTAEVPEPEPTNGVLANGTASTNGASKNGAHDSAKPAGDIEIAVEAPKKRRWGIFGRAK